MASYRRMDLQGGSVRDREAAAVAAAAAERSRVKPFSTNSFYYQTAFSHIDRNKLLNDFYSTFLLPLFPIIIFLL